MLSRKAPKTMDFEVDLSACLCINKKTRAVQNLISSLYETADPVAIEVIIIDMSGGKAASLNNDFPQIKTVDLGRQPPVRARNQALQLATGRYLSLWDHDMVVKPECLLNMLNFLDDTPDVGLAGPKIRNVFGDTESCCRAFPSPLPLLLLHAPIQYWDFNHRFLKHYLQVDFGYNRTREVDWLCSGVHVFRRELLEDIGFLDENFSLQFAEMDYYARAKKAGWHNFFINDAEVFHSNARRYNPELNESIPFFSLAHDSLRYFAKKWFRGQPG